jgi:Osmosensitive K+ channel histidine kinase
VINNEQKALPFRKRFKRHYLLPTKLPKNKAGEFDEKELASAVTREYRKVLGEELESPGTKLVVVDSFTRWSDYVLEYNQIVHSGYDIYRNYNDNVKSMLNRVNATAEKTVVFTAVDEVVLVETENEHLQERSRRCKIYGRELEGKIESYFTIVLFTKTEKQPNGTLKYSFLTNSDGSCSAKSPAGMFKDLLIPNDLAVVLEAVGKYYEKSTPAKTVVKRRG